MGSGEREDRTLSAMVRVRNESEFLDSAVRSIVDEVDEVVLVDNQSTDRTPEIMERLASAYPGKIRCYGYDFELKRVGRETWEASADPRDGLSPHLTSSFYNWCLEHCTQSHVLKWDGDMIALPEFSLSLEAWRRTDAPVLIFNGANVHPDRRHLIRAKITDRETLLSALSVPGMPAWAVSLTYDYPEPRIFPRRNARYDNSIRWTQKLDATSIRDSENAFRAEKACYLHMKFCKKDPMSNYSDDLAAAILSNVDVGPPLEPEWRALLSRWEVGPE